MVAVAAARRGKKNTGILLTVFLARTNAPSRHETKQSNAANHKKPLKPPSTNPSIIHSGLRFDGEISFLPCFASKVAACCDVRPIVASSSSNACCRSVNEVVWNAGRLVVDSPMGLAAEASWRAVLNSNDKRFRIGRSSESSSIVLVGQNEKSSG